MLRQLKHRISVLSGGSTIHDRPTKSIIPKSHSIQSLVQLSFIYTSTSITEIIRRSRLRCFLVDEIDIFTFSSQKIFASSHLQLSVIFLIIFLYKQDKRVRSAGIQFIRRRLKFRSNWRASLSTATMKTQTKPVFIEFSIHFVFGVSNFCSHTKIPLNYTKFNTLESNLINWYVNAL